MALRIEKRDITKISVDAVVNFSNADLLYEGEGTDRVIREAAGPELDNALSQIGSCEVGSAVMTDSYNMPKCKHIIHIARPHDSVKGEKRKQLFESCFISALDLAASHQLKSIAFPLSADFDLDSEIAVLYQTLVSSIRLWLSGGDDLDVRLVPDPRCRGHLRQMINSGYRYYCLRNQKLATKTDAPLEHVLEATHSVFSSKHHYRSNPYRDFIVGPLVEGAAVYSSASAPDPEDYSAQDLSFAEMCMWWCEKKKIGKGDFLSRSNITRATFSNIMRHPETIPKKTTVLACAIGLELDLDQTEDLLLRAGMALSRYYGLDRYVSQCIRCKQYDIDAINFELFDMDLPLLGYSRKD